MVLVLLTAAVAPRLVAQGVPAVGSEIESYLRLLAVNGVLAPQAWSARPFAPAVYARWLGDTLTPHPWRARLVGAGPGTGGRLLPTSVALSYNSALPWGTNDGAVWQGKGVTAWVSSGVGWRAGPLSVQLDPVAFVAQNAAFALVPPIYGARPNPYLNDNTLGLDLPQRFGGGQYARLDPGQSHIRLDLFGVAVGVSSENMGWGPAPRNNMLFTANAAGFPHLFVGTSEPLRTPVGRFNGQVVYGRPSQSAWAPDRRGDGTRFGSGVIVSWQPPDGRGFELGIARFSHRDWRDLNAEGWRAPFAGFFGDAQYAGAGVADNQLFSLFARVTSEQAGLELFGEFGKNDRNADLRDVVGEPEHNSAIALGLLKTIGDVHGAAFSSVRLEWMSARITSLVRFRGQSFFYDHTPITEGHTQLGQLLGSPLMERSGGVELAWDRWSRAGRTGVMLTQRALPPTGDEGQPAEATRSQWALEASALRFRGRIDLTARAGVLFDLNRTPGKDVTSLFVGVGVGGR